MDSPLYITETDSEDEMIYEPPSAMEDFLVEDALRECLQRIENSETITLHSYQTENVRWMLKRELKKDEHGIRGGILADEMGLGKTVQALALCLARRTHTLILVPRVVLSQWVDKCIEILGQTPCVLLPKNLKPSNNDYFYADMDYLVMDGEPVPKANVVVLATHECLRDEQLNSHLNRETNWLLNNEWGRVIFDEAHVLKNIKSVGAQGAALLQAESKWAVTGTPVSTKKLPPKTPFTNIHKTNDLKGLICFLSGNVNNGFFKTTADALAFNKVERRKLFRRNTKETIDIPLPEAATLKLLVLPFSDQEAQEYAREYARGQSVVIEEVDNSGIEIIKIMQKLRMMCICNTKLTALQSEFEERRRPGARSIVFCHWIDEIEKVTAALASKVDRVMKYHGRVPHWEKQEIVDAFQGDSRESMVIIMQIAAGGVGLNLQSATHVYMFSPNWSAAAEMQAIGRACRIDTQHPVTVVRYVMQNSIEEYMHKRQKSKLETAAEMLFEEPLSDALTAYEVDEYGRRLRREVSWSEVCQLFASPAFDRFFHV